MAEPLSKGDSSIDLADIPAGEAALQIEVVVDGGVDGGGLLQTSHATKPMHRPFSSSRWQVRVLDPVVQPAASCLQVLRSQSWQGVPIRRQVIGDDLLGPTVSAHQSPEEFQRRAFVSTLGDDRFEHLALMIDGAPEVMPLGIDLHECVVDVPAPVREGLHPIDAPAPDLGREHRSKPVPPGPDRLVADVNPALPQQVLDVPRRQQEPDRNHHGKADDLGRHS